MAAPERNAPSDLSCFKTESFNSVVKTLKMTRVYDDCQRGSQNQKLQDVVALSQRLLRRGWGQIIACTKCVILQHQRPQIASFSFQQSTLVSIKLRL